VGKICDFSLLALDVATQCGFAYTDGDQIESGVWDLSTLRDESGSMKLLRFESQLEKVLSRGVQVLVYEAARNAAPSMQGALVHQAQLQGVLKYWSEKNGIKYYEGYSPTTIKRFATSNGAASKEMMVEACQKIFGYKKVTDDNEADALALLHLAIEKYGKCAAFLKEHNIAVDAKVINIPDIDVSPLTVKAIEEGRFSPIKPKTVKKEKAPKKGNDKK
jgi:Holliday junction resolvasome RuvABC endonuclease subunit